MGKQTKRKQRFKNKQIGGSPIPQQLDPVDTLTSTHVINRIRHGDVRIRHAALTGLSTTLFSSESLSNGHERVKYELIQAVAERIMDSDMPTSCAAAGCIGNYTLFGVQQVDYTKVGVMVLPIALAKLKTSIDQAVQMQHQSTHMCQQGQQVALSNNPIGIQMEKQAKRIMEKITLVSLCLNIICALIENADSDVSSILLNLNQMDDFLDVILSIVSYTSGILSHSSSSSLSPSDSAIKALLDQESEGNILGDCLYFSMRTLHSCLDENPSLTQKVFHRRDPVFTLLIDTLQNSSLPPLSRLHAAGIVVGLGNSIFSEKYQPFRTFRNVDDIVVQLVLPLLRQYLVFHSDIALAMMQRIKIAEKEVEQTQMDEALEKEVIKSVNRQSESARLIARRQAAMKGTMRTEEDSDQKVQADAPTNLPPRDDTEDTVDRYEKSISTWTNACLPLKLALEVAANICTAQELNEEDVQMNSSENDHVDFETWDEEKEKRLLGGMDPLQDNAGEPINSAASQQLLQSDIPDIILKTFVDAFVHCTINTWNPRADDIPKKASLDVGDIFIKCSVCLGNMLSIVVSSWKTDVVQANAVWKKFCQILEEELRSADTDTLQQALVIAAITHVLGSLIRFRSSIVPLIDEIELGIIFQCVSFGLSHKYPSSDQKGQLDNIRGVIEDVQKDSVNILGELCRHPHSDELNSRVCNTLISYLKSAENTSTAVMIEILNVLMDLYSADETDLYNHEKVFRSRDVLSIFIRWVPLLKKRIADEKGSPLSTSNYSMWEETLFNAKRFIQYKKSRS